MFFLVSRKNTSANGNHACMRRDLSNATLISVVAPDRCWLSAKRSALGAAGAGAQRRAKQAARLSYGLNSYVICSYGLNCYGLFNYGLNSYRICSYGLNSHGRCETGSQTRTRRITTKAAYGGASCPSTTERRYAGQNKKKCQDYVGHNCLGQSDLGHN